VSETFLECLVCSTRYDFGAHLLGCRACAERKHKAALVPRYMATAAEFHDTKGPGLWRYRALLPPVNPVSLGEEGTLLVPFRGLLIKNG
jgi:hypothetical protein